MEGAYDSSGKLQTQIEEGLGADIYMSAAMTQMNNLKEQDFVEAASIVELPENKIVLIVPADVDTEIASFEDSASAEVAALDDPESVPAGSLETKVIYPVGIDSESTHKEEAQLFIGFLCSDEAIAVFEQYGFTRNK